MNFKSTRNKILPHLPAPSSPIMLPDSSLTCGTHEGELPLHPALSIDACRNDCTSAYIPSERA